MRRTINGAIFWPTLYIANFLNIVPERQIGPTALCSKLAVYSYSKDLCFLKLVKRFIKLRQNLVTYFCQYSIRRYHTDLQTKFITKALHWSVSF